MQVSSDESGDKLLVELGATGPTARAVRTGVRQAQLIRCAMNGYTAIDAARALGLNVAVVRQVYRSPDFKRAVLQRVEDILDENADAPFEALQLSLHDKIRAKSERAFETLCDMLDDDEVAPAVRAKIAQDMLDRNPESQAGSTIRHGSLIDADALRHAASVAREMDNVVPMPPRNKETA